MILFQSDYAKMGTAKPDYQTKNTSFLEISRLYHEMGVKNCVFALTLLQASLVGVDPHSENLTLEQKAQIGIECRLNPWYYFRECVRIPGVASNESISFKANRGNISMIWCFFNHIDYALIQPRQTGKSVSTDTLMCWLLFIGCLNTLINMITKDNDLRVKNVERLKKIRDLLPPYLVPRDKKDPDNQSELKCVTLGNHYQTGVAQPNETAANKIGRGLTSAIVHFDEAPFISHIGTTLPAALSSGNAARDEAAKFKRPYGNVFTTTAGKKDDRDGKYMYDMIHGGTVWDEVYYDCKNHAHLQDMLIKNKASTGKLIINGTFSHRQLGYTDAWLYGKMSASNSFGDDANRDYFNIWTSGTQGSPLSPKLNEAIRQSEREIKYRMMTKDGFIVRWYVTEEELNYRRQTTKIIMGLDTSEGIGRDGIGAVFLDAYTLEVIGAFNTNETNLILFSSFVVELMLEFDNIILIPERKSSAQTIIDLLLLKLPAAGLDPFKRIYNVIVDEQTTRKEEFKAVSQDIGRRNRSFFDQYKRFFGFVTTAASRDILYQQVLQNAAKSAGHLVQDKVLSSEIRGLIVKNGRIDHSSSSHDDLVIAWMLCHWMLTFSRNLHFYGIDTSRMASALSNDLTNEMTDEQKMERDQQKELMASLDTIVAELDDCKDDIQAMKLEHKLKVVYMKLRPSDKDAISIDAVIREAGDKRKANKRVMRQDVMEIDMSKAWGNQNTYRRTGNANVSNW